MLIWKKTFMGVAAAATMTVIPAATLSSLPASAAEVAPCFITGDAWFDGAGMTNATAASTGQVRLFLDCPGVGTAAGHWNLYAAISSPAASCAVDNAGSGTFTGGGGPETVVGGSFSFQRGGPALHAEGTLRTTGATYAFSAEVILQYAATCFLQNTTYSQIAAGSTAVLRAD